MIHGLAICLALAAALAVFGLLALLIVGGLPAAKPRPHQPGALGRDDTWDEIDTWERDKAAWEAEGNWPAVHRAEDTTGGDGA